MKKNKLLYILLTFTLCFSVIFLLGSCSNNNITTLVCNNDQFFVDGQCISSDLYESIKGENANYLFDSDKKNKDIEESILILENIVDKFILLGIAKDKQLSYYITSENINYLNENDGIIYLGIDNISSFETVFHSLLNLHDKKVNYGLLYGLATYLSVELGFVDEKKILTDEIVEPFLNEDYYDLMDITFPTFSESYTTKENIVLVKQFSNCFVKYLVDKHDIYSVISLLKILDFDEFEYRYKAYLNEWIKFNGFDYEVKINEFPIFFDRNPETYYSIWYSKHATWYLHENYKKKEWILFLSKNFLMNNYKELKRNIAIFENEMSRIDNLLKSDEINYVSLRIHIGPAPVSSYNSGFMQLALIPAFSHEYVHYITLPYMTNSQWLLEAVAAYYSFDFYYMDRYIEETYFGSSDFGDFSLKVNKAVEEFENIYNREIKYRVDKYEWVDVYVYLDDQYDDVYQVYNNDSIFQYISFVNYMIDQYGHTTFVTICEDFGMLEELTGKSWQIHINDWEDYINDKFMSLVED